MSQGRKLEKPFDEKSFGFFLWEKINDGALTLTEAATIMAIHPNQLGVYIKGRKLPTRELAEEKRWRQRLPQLLPEKWSGQDDERLKGFIDNFPARVPSLPHGKHARLSLREQEQQEVFTKIGRELVAIREEAKLTKVELAARIYTPGVRNNIDELESGRLRSWSLSKAAKDTYAKACQLPPNDARVASIDRYLKRAKAIAAKRAACGE